MTINRTIFGGNLLMDILELFQMKQVIADPTRITSNTASLLDIIATNRPDKVKESGVIHLGISDHSLVYQRSQLSLKVSVPRDKPKIVESRNLTISIISIFTFLIC